MRTIWVRVGITVNGVEVFYTSSVDALMWSFPEFQLAMIKNLKTRALDAATRGMEPKVEVFDEMPPGGSSIPELAHGHDVQIGAQQ